MFNNTVAEQFQHITTPFYYYDRSLLDATLAQIRTHAIDAGYHVHYALKANFNDKILNIIREAGLGADCVSGNEVKKALASGFKPKQIAFAGVGKTDKEINYALEQQIFSFNCESLQEIEVINALASAKGLTADIAIRINPNVDAKTHKYITTGLEENKFGINVWELDDLISLLQQSNNIQLKGLHFHIGSQITDLKPFHGLCDKVNDLQHYFEDKGINLEHINVGGGLGVDYAAPDEYAIPDFKAYFQVFKDQLKLRAGQELHFELGRSIVAQCGSVIARVLYIKRGINTDFAIIDAGMTELIRPALYQASHTVQAINSTGEDTIYDVVGPICESSDAFARRISLPKLQRGHLIAIRSAGAYGEVMSSGYNLRERAASVFSDELPPSH